MRNSGKAGSGLFLCHGTEAFDVGNVGREGRRLPWLRLREQRVRRHTREPSQRAWPVTANQTGDMESEWLSHPWPVPPGQGVNTPAGYCGWACTAAGGTELVLWINGKTPVQSPGVASPAPG